MSLPAVIRIARRQGVKLAPGGVAVHYPQGDYKVPDEMPAADAEKILRFGVGLPIRTADTKLDTKKSKPKRKRSPRKAGSKP